MKKLLSRLYGALPSWLTSAVLRALHIRFSVSVAGLYVTNDGRVLLLRHVYRHSYPWGLPSGFLSAGEGPEEGALRELREETGLHATAERILRAGPILRRHLEIIVAGRIDPAQTPRLSHEIFEAGFFGVNTLPEPMPPDQRATIERYLRSL